MKRESNFISFFFFNLTSFEKSKETCLTCFACPLACVCAISGWGPHPHARTRSCVGSYKTLHLEQSVPSIQTQLSLHLDPPSHTHLQLSVSFRSNCSSGEVGGGTFGKWPQSRLRVSNQSLYGKNTLVCGVANCSLKSALKSLATRVHVFFGVVACFYLLFRVGI